MASRTPAQISADIIAKLAVTAPGLSLGVGTPERKFVDIVAEAISEAQVDNYLTSTQLDIDTKSGSDLEDFVGIFGFGRLQGTYATGLGIVTLNIPAVQAYTIGVGSQFFSTASNGTALTFNSTATVALNVGDLTASIPLQCATIGTAGNVPSGSVTGFSSGLGFSTVTNLESFVGGTDNETDEELRARFKKTLLRNIAGTEDFYSAISLQIAANGNTSATGVSRVQVLGPVSDFSTQVQVGTINTPLTLPSKNCKYVWTQGDAVALNAGTSAENWFTNGTDYSFTNGAISAPIITPLNSSTASQFLDVSYEYCSTNSRNDPVTGKTNKVDIFVDGSNPQAVSETIITNATTLNSTGGSVYNIANFASNPAGTTMVAGTTKFQRLGSTPILSWPASIVIGATTYTLGTNYVGVYDTTTNRGSEREVSGIAWITTAPANGLSGTVNYTYNQTPQVLNSIFKKQKQITTDVLVHQAVNKYLRFYFVVMYDRGVAPSQVQPNIASALNNFISGQSFGAWIQFSDLTNVVHNVSGVDNVRMATTSDGAPFTASEVVGGNPTGSPFTSDFQLQDNTIPVLDIPTHVVSTVTVADYDSMFIRRSQNSF
jgi:uncharacterized phage protein gp47/JayE